MEAFNVTDIITRSRNSKKVSSGFVPSEAVVSNHVREQFETIVNIWMCSLLALTGTITNLLVIFTLIKQGLTESVNISLITIAGWDLMVCLFGGVNRLYALVKLVDVEVGESWRNVGHATLQYVQVFSGIVSGCLGAYLALERCLCVCDPFNVKLWFTPRRTTWAMVIISVVTCGSLFHMYFIFDLFLTYRQVYNATIVGLRYSKFMTENVDAILASYNVIPFFWPTVSFIIMLICTVLIVRKLKMSSKFRGKCANPNDYQAKNHISKRDSKVSKMLLVVILVYILTISPRLASYVYRSIDETFIHQGEKHNLFYVVSYVLFLLNFVNASVNFFIYIKMSSGFRKSFLQMLKLQQNTNFKKGSQTE